MFSDYRRDVTLIYFSQCRMKIRITGHGTVFVIEHGDKRGNKNNISGPCQVCVCRVGVMNWKERRQLIYGERKD
jgi:hypothetical protein